MNAPPRDAAGPTRLAATLSVLNAIVGDYLRRRANPLQIELAVLIASDDPAAGTKHWSDCSIPAGRLFLVGDPKQSIYRFRRADVLVYDRVAEVVARSAHVSVTLSTNFRSVGPLIDWLDDRFERAFGHPLIISTGGVPVPPSATA